MDNKIRVIISGVEVGYYNVSDTGVAFTWQSKLIDEINSYSVTTTKTITLPLTKELNKLLKSPSVIDTTDSLSNREYVEIEITWNDTVAIRGHIKLGEVFIFENDEYIEITVEPKEKTWIEEFRQQTLPQIDFTTGVSQAHSLTYSNIVGSETFLATREYVYAPIDIAEVGRLQVLWVSQVGSDTFYWYYGNQISSTTFIATAYGFSETQLNRNDETFTDVPDTFWNARGVYKAKTSTPIIPLVYVGQQGYLWSQEVDYWQVSDFYPCIRHKNIIKRAFNQIGYDVTIVDTEDYFNDKYSFLVNTEQLNKFEQERTKLKVRVPDGGYELSSVSAATFITPFFNIEESGSNPSIYFDDTDSDDFTAVSGGANLSRFEAQETCILNFKWDYEIGYDISGGTVTATTAPDLVLYMKQYDNTNTLVKSVQFDLKYSTSRVVSFSVFKGTIEENFLMDSGDYVECEIHYLDIFSAGATGEITIFDTNTLEIKHYEGGNFKGKVVRLNEYLPDVTTYDYIKDLSFINNWEFYTNETQKHVYIVREDYKRTGKLIDFKTKLDLKEGVSLTEVGLLHPKKYYFQWKKDDNDLLAKFIEDALRKGLGDQYDKEEIEMVCRYAHGTIDNLNVFRIDKEEISCKVYSASVDKYTATGINFNTIQMFGNQTYKTKPTYKRVDYEPRYLTVTFGETLEDNGVGGVTSVRYSIVNNTNHTTYPWASFQTPLFFGGEGGLIATKYAKRKRAIRYGWILKGAFELTENDVNSFIETYEDNNFRGDYDLMLKGVNKIGELLRVTDFSPATSSTTEIEFIIYRDNG